MLGTLISIAISIFFYFNPLSNETIANDSAVLSTILLIIASLFVLIQSGITLFAWSPLQKAEQNLTPHLIKEFQNDWSIRAYNLFLLFFLLLTFVAAIDITFLHTFDVTYLLIGWSLLFGLSIDVLHCFFNKVMGYLDPFSVVEHFGKTALDGVIVSNEEEICDWIDALSETAIKAAEKNNLSLAFLALDKLRLISEDYLQVAKGVTYHEEDDEGTSDHVGYVLFYLFERLEMIFKKGDEKSLDPLCNEVITVLGKITYYSADYDITVANYPLHYLTKLGEWAQDHKLPEIANRTTVTLTEVSSAIGTDIDLEYVEIKEYFLSVIKCLHDMARETFRTDKSISISILTQPFEQLKDLFTKSKLNKHRDANVVIQNLDQAIEEFATLQTILQTMPPLPGLEKEGGLPEKKTEG